MSQNTTQTEAFEFESSGDEDAFREHIREIIRCMVVIQDENDQIKEIVNEVYSTIGVPKSMTKRVARLLFKSKVAEYSEEAEVVQQLCDSAKPKKGVE